MLFILNFSLTTKEEIKSDNFHQAKIIETYQTSCFVYEDHQTYYLILQEDTKKLENGDIISYTGKYQQYEENDSFKTFLLSNQTTFYLSINEFNLDKEKDNFRNRLFAKLKTEETIYSTYSLTILYKYQTPQNQHYLEKINQLGISYLIVISGFHISLIFRILEKSLNKFIKNQKTISIIASIISFIFLYLLYFPPSGNRAWIYQNIKRTTKLDNFQSLSISGIIMLYLNPWNILSFGLILSFAITFLILIFANSKIKPILKKIFIPCFAFLFSTIIISIWETSFNLLAPLLSILLTPIIEWLYLLILIFLPFPNLWFLLSPFLYLLSDFFILFNHFYWPIQINQNSIIFVYFFLMINFYFINHFKNKPYSLIISFLLSFICLWAIQFII